jgi:hypothetical protein
LNFLQRLSGIATQARDYVGEVAGTSVKLVDTRKTTPGWRVLEKYAVRIGGAHNHRMGLYDGVLIKDNHIAVSGGIANAVKKARQAISHLVKIEVETSTLEEVQEALAAGADIIMLDNMDLDQIRRAVRLIDKRALVEVSGGVTRQAAQGAGPNRRGSHLHRRPDPLGRGRGPEHEYHCELRNSGIEGLSMLQFLRFLNSTCTSFFSCSRRSEGAVKMPRSRIANPESGHDPSR